MSMIHPAFKEIEAAEIPELHSKGKVFEHKKTGAQVVIIENDDINKVFAINYKTIPSDDSGVAHILEHLVFNGTKKYKVKNLIDELIKSSVNTYVNAYTAPDRTVYPIASQNEKDFYNLADVYISMTQEPLLEKEGFMQEGWRVDKNENNDPILTGIVFNEMKAYTLDPENILWKKALLHTLPDTIYAHKSGGDPISITDLTHEELIAFHKKYYNISNAQFFFYGDGDTEKHLDFLHENIKHLEPLRNTYSIEDQPIFIEKDVTDTYPAGEHLPLEEQFSLVKLWRLDSHIPKDEELGLIVLNYLLLSSDSALLKNSLIQNELGEDVIDDGFYFGMKQGIFMLGIKNGTKANISKAKKLIDTQLLEISEKGFKPESIQAAIERLEFAAREMGNSNPKGMAFLRSVTSDWNYGNSPLEGLYFEENFKNIRNLLKEDDSYLKELLKKHLLNSPSVVNLTLEPDPEFVTKREKLNQKQLEEKLKTISTDEIDKISERVKHYQETDDSNINTLPKLEIEDLDKNIKIISYEAIQKDSVRILKHALPTNGILHVSLSTDISHLTLREHQLLGILESIIDRSPSNNYSRDELADRIDTYTGGISMNSFYSETLTGESIQKLTLKSKMMYRNVDEMLKLLKEYMFEIKLNDKKILREVLLNQKSRIESSLISSGHSFALSYAMSSRNVSSYLDEKTGGISYLEFIRDLIKNLDAEYNNVLSNLQDLYSKLYIKNNAIISYSLEENSEINEDDFQNSLLNLLPSKSYPKKEYEIEAVQDTGFSVSSEVQFCSMVLPFENEVKNPGVFTLTNRLASLNYIWKEIRLKGGAYGGGISFKPLEKAITFFSYRDPELDKTFDVFQKTSDFLRSGVITESELKKGIIGVIGDQDGHILDASKHHVSLVRELVGITDSYRQNKRDQIFSTSLEDFEKYADLIDSINTRNIVKSVIGNKERITNSKIDFKQKPLL